MLRRCWFALVVLSASMLLLRAADNPDPLPDGATLRLGTVKLRSALFDNPISVDALTPDGKYLIGRSTREGRVYLDPATGKTVRVLGHEGKQNEDLSEIVTLSANGKRAVAVSLRQVAVVDTETGKVLAKLDRDVQSGHDSVSLSADGKRLALGSERLPAGKAGMSASVWDVEANKQLTSVAPGSTKAFVALSPNGKLLATWSELRTGFGGAPGPAPSARIWDAETGKEFMNVQIPGKGSITAITFSPDSRLVAASCGSGSIHLIDTNTKKETLALHGSSGQGYRIAFSPDGKTIAATTDDEIVQRWDASDGRLIDTTEPPIPAPTRPALATRMGRYVRGFTFAENNRVIVWGFRGDCVVVWEAPSGKAISPTDGHYGRISGIATGKEFLTASEGGAVIRWDTTSGKQLATITLKVPAAKQPTSQTASGPVLLSPNGSWAIVQSSSTPQAVYSLPSGQQHFVIPGTSRQSTTTFNRDGSKIVCCSTGDEKANAIP